MKLIEQKELDELDQWTQLEIILSYFYSNQEKHIKHPEVVDWAVKKWAQKTGKVFRDPDRAIRTLYAKGFLLKISKGIYQFNKHYESTNDKTIFNFTEKQKQEILKRGNYTCVICGSNKDNAEMHVDHIKAMSNGGENTIDNGQVLCSRHNFLKKNLSQTETGKRMFINLHRLAIKCKDDELTNFVNEVLEVYKKHNINGHIQWNDEKK